MRRMWHIVGEMAHLSGKIRDSKNHAIQAMRNDGPLKEKALLSST